MPIKLFMSFLLMPVKLVLGVGRGLLGIVLKVLTLPFRIFGRR